MERWLDRAILLLPCFNPLFQCRAGDAPALPTRMTGNSPFAINSYTFVRPNPSVLITSGMRRSKRREPCSCMFSISRNLSSCELKELDGLPVSLFDTTGSTQQEPVCSRKRVQNKCTRYETGFERHCAEYSGNIDALFSVHSWESLLRRSSCGCHHPYIARQHENGKQSAAIALCFRKKGLQLKSAHHNSGPIYRRE